MVLLGIIFLGVIVFLALSLFSPELREKAVTKSKGVVDTIFNKAPIIADNVIINPLKERASRLRSGAGVGSIRIEAGDV